MPQSFPSLVGCLFLCTILNVSYTTAIRGEHAKHAEENEFPFVVSLSTVNTNAILPAEAFQFCTGTLISKRHVLTAEHCLQEVVPDDVEVIVGSLDLKEGEKYRPKSWITYNEWKTGRKNEPTVHDIAIVTLKEEVSNPGVKPANILLSAPCNRPGSHLKIVGWGKVDSGAKARILQKASLKLLSRDRCKKQLYILANKDFPMLQQDMCTWADPRILISCGDSGGPLLNNQNMLVGVNLATCPQFRKPGVPLPIWNRYQVNLHTSVYYYKTFIEHVIKTN